MFYCFPPALDFLHGDFAFQSFHKKTFRKLTTDVILSFVCWH
jgi:hypothetical protein